MKKVLALVLAVVMVCTMALAVEINPANPADPGTTSPDSVAVSGNIKPGETVKLVLTDKDGKAVTPYLKDGKFVPANNVVTVTFAKGAEFVKSQGWVKLKGATTEDMNAYEYQITFKEDLTKVTDPKVAEIVISGVTFKATGYNLNTLLKATKNSEMLGYSYGYPKTTLTLTEGTDGYTGFANVTGGTVNVVESITNKKGEAVSAAEVEIKTGTYTLTYSLTKGMKFFATDKTIEFTEKDTGFKTSTIPVADITNLNNIAGKAVVALKENAGNNYKVYAKTVDGKVLSVAATNNDGVLSFSVPAMSRVIVTTDTLTVSGTAGTTTTPGTTTNPGTGANDVVGVAAALAVVALVSGAAISLKK